MVEEDLEMSGHLNIAMFRIGKGKNNTKGSHWPISTEVNQEQWTAAVSNTNCMLIFWCLPKRCVTTFIRICTDISQKVFLSCNMSNVSLFVQREREERERELLQPVANSNLD